MASLFEKIAQHEISSSIIRENDEFMAFLDIMPNCVGQTLVIPKTWYESDIALMPEDVYSRYMLAVKHVIALLKKWLGCNRVGVIMEGMWVNHAHVKLYPMHGLTDTRTPNEKHDETVWFDTYPGYMTTMVGEIKSKEELDEIAQKVIQHTI